MAGELRPDLRGKGHPLPGEPGGFKNFRGFPEDMRLFFRATAESQRHRVVRGRFPAHSQAMALFTGNQRNRLSPTAAPQKLSQTPGQDSQALFRRYRSVMLPSFHQDGSRAYLPPALWGGLRNAGRG